MSREYVEEQQYQARESRRQYWDGWLEFLVVVLSLAMAWAVIVTLMPLVFSGDPLMLWREMLANGMSGG